MGSGWGSFTPTKIRAFMAGANTGSQVLTDPGGGVTAALVAAFDTISEDSGGFTAGHGLADGKLAVPKAGDYIVVVSAGIEPLGAVGHEYRMSMFVGVNGFNNPIHQPGGKFYAIDALNLAPANVAAAIPEYTTNTAGVLLGLSAGDLVNLVAGFSGAAAPNNTASAFVGLFGLVWLG